MQTISDFNISNSRKVIKSRRDSWYFSPRRKNIVTLTELGLDQEEIFEIIIENLSWSISALIFSYVIRSCLYSLFINSYSSQDIYCKKVTINIIKYKDQNQMIMNHQFLEIFGYLA